MITSASEQSGRQGGMPLRKKLFRPIALLCILCLFSIQVSASSVESPDPKMLVPVGRCIGIRLFCEGLIVTGFQSVTHNGSVCCPAKEAGIQCGDIILKANGRKLASHNDLSDTLAESDSVSLLILREEKRIELTVKPVKKSEENARIGCFVRDSTAGLGTVTFFDPETNLVAGLGHPICDSDTGITVPVREGSLLKAEVKGAERGMIGAPGMLIGSFPIQENIALLLSNRSSGIYGITETDSYFNVSNAMPVAEPEQIRIGEAEILCTLSGTNAKLYSICITRVSNLNDNDLRDFEIRVTDAELLSTVGGIVQGMSGSPILQDGRIIGAVTHVFINDPTKGYGIYVGKMIADGMEELKRAG